MKRKIIILWTLILSSLVFWTIFWIKQFNSGNEANTGEYKIFSWQILNQEKQISNSWCIVWDQVYLGLAQNYKYNNEYSLSLKTLSNLAECYPKAYKIKSSKSLLLLNNIWDIYETWWYSLKEKWDNNYKAKYQKALDSYEKILKVFKNSKDLDNDTKKWYEEKIKRVKEMMK